MNETIDKILSDDTILLNEALIMIQKEIQEHSPIDIEDIENDLVHAFLAD